MTFGEKLRELRKGKSLTIKSLSEKSGISISYITMLENNMLKNPPTQKKAEQLECVLGAKNRELVSYTVTKSTTQLIQVINSNPENARKMFDVLNKIHGNPKALDEILRLLKGK